MTAQIELIARQAAASTSTCRTFEPDVCDGCNGRLEAARATAKALTAQPAISAEPLPVVAHRGPHDTDISMFEGIAERLEGDYPVGGSNVRDALVRLIRREIDRAAGLTVAGESQ